MIQNAYNFTTKNIYKYIYIYIYIYYSSLQCHMIFQKSSNMPIVTQETFLIIINVKKSSAASNLCRYHDVKSFRRVSKNDFYSENALN